MGPFKHIRNERGAALILAIMAMVIMTTVIVEFAYNTRVDIAMVSNYRATQQGRYFSEVGIEAAKVLLLSDLERDALDGRLIDYYAYDASRATEDGTTPIQGAMAGLAGGGAGGGMPGGVAAGGELNEVWSLMTEELPAIPLADTGAQIKLTIQDESGKVNLNQFDVPRGFELSSPLGQRWVAFFMACGLEEQDAAALVPLLQDWIDKNDEAVTNGAESSYYQQLNPGFMARNGVMFGLDELRLIEGIKPEVWSKIAPHVTVYPQVGAVGSRLNVNTASKEALQFLDKALDAELAQAVIDERNNTPFESDSKFRDVINAFGSTDLTQRVVTAGIALRSDVFSVRSSAVVGGVEYTVRAVLERARGSKEIKVHYWRAD